MARNARIASIGDVRKVTVVRRMEPNDMNAPHFVAADRPSESAFTTTATLKVKTIFGRAAVAAK